MMKKLLLLSSAVFAFTANISAQSNFVVGNAPAVAKHPANDVANSNTNAKVSSASITDTLWYFYNKHYYRNPASTGFYTLKNAPTYTSASVATSGGAIFKNTGNMVVSGAEGVVARQASSPSATVNVGLFLYNVVGGVPTGVAVNSVIATITGTAGSFIGANFTAPSIVTGDYAIVMKNVSTNPLDTVRLFINNALTFTSSSTNTAAKYGEGFGVVGVGTLTFQTTTNVFGAGTDYEFIVAPRVTYSITTTAVTPTLTPLCMFTAYTFTNSSSAWIGHRQYNLNEFAVEWAPFGNTSAAISANPVYTWAYGDATTPATTNGTVTTVNHTYGTAGTFAGSLTSKTQRMSDYSGNSTTDVSSFSKTSSACGPVGIKSVSGFETFNLFPNPTVSGRTNITGLVGDNIITVYNALGQVAFVQKTSNEAVSIDLSAQPVGNYFVRVTNSNNATKTVKIINQ